MKLTLCINPDGNRFYLETPDGQKLPNIVECKLPAALPHDYIKKDFPLVTVSFVLQDIVIKTTDI